MDKLYILVAEDDADDRLLLETAFADKGYRGIIDFVENGVEVLNYLERINQEKSGHPVYPRLILLDLNMPKKDGREVLKEIRQHPVFKRIPVIIFTTTKGEKEVNSCYDLGCNGYVMKPDSYEELLKITGDICTFWFETAVIPS